MFEFAVQEIRRNITMCVHTFMLYFLSVRMKKRQIVIMLVYNDKLYIYVVSYDNDPSHENKIPPNCFVPQLHTHIRVYPSISLRGNFEDLMTRNGVPLEYVMVYEALRLKSFFGVDIAVSRIQLAKAGFYATGNGDETRCFSCGVRYRNWQHGERPASVPHKHNCRHNHDLHRGNVSFTENPLSSSIDCALTRLWYPTSDFDVHDPSPETQRLSITHPNRRPTSAISPHPTTGTNHQAPCYSSETNRLASFRGWPSESSLRELSAAGFYYTGNSDNVRCFRCGLALTAGDDEDDPWRVHARLRPNCPFLATRCPTDTTPQVAESRSHEMQPQKTDPKHKEETKDLTESNLLKATKENTEQLRESSTCKVCLENPANIVFLPCGHLVACGVCSPALERCPVCRKHIRGTVRVHLAHMASREATTQNTSHNVVTSSQTAERANMGYNNHQSEQISGNISPKQSTLSDSERGNNGINNSNAAVNASLSLPVTSQSRKAERNQKHDKTKDQLMATKEETRQLRESSTCKVCLENPANIVFLPCGHLVACGVCSPALERCPVCRKHIRGTVRVHLAHMASREATTQNTSHNVVTSSQTAERANMGYNNHQSEQISGNISPKQSTLSDSERGNNGINNSNAAVNASLSLPVTSQSRKAERNQKHDKTKDQLMATKEETRQLRESSTCKVCLENPANIVFLPCGHLVACGVCSPALERCPVCRKHIRGTVRVHLAHMASREATTQNTSHNVVTSSQTAERANMGYNNHQSEQISGNISPKQSTLSDSERGNNGINNSNAAVNASLSLPVTSQSRKAERNQKHDKTKDQLMATKEETRQLRESSTCKVCLENPANIVFLPCGHLVACGVCSPALERCPVCRKHIRGTVRVHLAHMASREATTQNTSHNVVTSSQTAERANMGYNNHQSEQISGNISPKQSTLSDSERGNNGINNSNAAVNASLSLPVTSQSRKAERNQKHDKTKDQLMATKEETRQLRESSTCKVCLENPANIIFLPCGHLVACGVCSPALERCPVCRTHIRGSVRVHLSDMASLA